MPLFYFDLRENGTLIEDDEGLLVLDIVAAQREAMQAAADIGWDRLREGEIQSVTIDLRDENGENLLSVTVSLTVTQY